MFAPAIPGCGREKLKAEIPTTENAQVFDTSPLILSPVEAERRHEFHGSARSNRKWEKISASISADQRFNSLPVLRSLAAKKFRMVRAFRGLTNAAPHPSSPPKHLIRPSATLTRSHPLARPFGPPATPIPFTASQAVQVSPSDAEKGNPIGEGGVRLSPV